MRNNFFKFPSTPHLAALPGADIRDDKVLTESERDEFLRHELLIEEKVDGANIGISLDSEGNIRVQNRSAYLQLPGSGQWKKLREWLSFRADAFFDNLSDRYILFGEWCYAQHSVFYNRLPDWFLAFDIFDKESRRFLSSVKRDWLLGKMHIFKVPRIAHGRFYYPKLKVLLSQSKLTDRPAEGIYLRLDHGDWLCKRAKLVRPAFIQSIEHHWSRFSIRPNQIKTETMLEVR